MYLFLLPFLTVLPDELNRIQYKRLLQLGGKNIPTCTLNSCLNLFNVLPGMALSHVSWGTCSIGTSGKLCGSRDSTRPPTLPKSETQFVFAKAV